mmetsp:Transcript_15356/g.38810  ORF Transcript_15356/g.38810 Transcript_15356/m.38810 type:complete len:256 (-) Transcript_15356:657-1424(-)
MLHVCVCTCMRLHVCALHKKQALSSAFCVGVHSIAKAMSTRHCALCVHACTMHDLQLLLRVVFLFSPVHYPKLTQVSNRTPTALFCSLFEVEDTEVLIHFCPFPIQVAHPQMFHCFHHTHVSPFCVELQGPLLVDVYPVSVSILIAEVKITIRISRLHCLSKKLNRLCFVYLHPTTLGVTRAQTDEGWNTPSICSFLVQLDCSLLISLHALTMTEAESQLMDHGHIASMTYYLLIQSNCLCIIPLYPQARAVAIG